MASTHIQFNNVMLNEEKRNQMNISADERSNGKKSTQCNIHIKYTYLTSKKICWSLSLPFSESFSHSSVILCESMGHLLQANLVVVPLRVSDSTAVWTALLSLFFLSFHSDSFQTSNPFFFFFFDFPYTKRNHQTNSRKKVTFFL